MVKAAKEDYKFLTQTTSSLLIEDTRLTIGKIRKFLRDVDLSAEDDKGKPKYTIQSITSATSQLPKLARDLAEAQKEIDKEIAENSQMRGKQTKKVMEDGLRRNR
jgi:DNA-binding transcriptional MerR regulator